jgi:hypothetical protein
VDGIRFDVIAREAAHGMSRRQAVRLVAAALAGVGAVVGHGTIEAARRCRPLRAACHKDGDCCSGQCTSRSKRVAGQCTCASGIVCDTTCCPPETVGCTEIATPDGVRTGCLCRDGLVYDAVTNTCSEPTTCRAGVGACHSIGQACGNDGLPCCSGGCSGGVCSCLPEGSACTDQYDCCLGTVCDAGICTAVVTGGTCTTDADCGIGAYCLAAPGQTGACDECYSGTASNGGISVSDCPWPMPGYVCAPNPTTGFPGFGYCCIPGENCAGDPCALECPSDDSAQGGAAVCNGL